MWQKFNAHPSGKKTGDCAIRAVAVATSIPWKQAYRELANNGISLEVEMSEPEAVEAVLVSHGFRVGKISKQAGVKKPTVSQFATMHPEWVCVLRVANHFVATAGGHYIDTWDSGNKSIYKYWYKPVERQV